MPPVIKRNTCVIGNRVSLPPPLFLPSQHVARAHLQLTPTLLAAALFMMFVFLERGVVLLAVVSMSLSSQLIPFMVAVGLSSVPPPPPSRLAAYTNPCPSIITIASFHSHLLLYPSLLHLGGEHLEAFHQGERKHTIHGNRLDWAVGRREVTEEMYARLADSLGVFVCLPGRHGHWVQDMQDKVFFCVFHLNGGE